MGGTAALLTEALAADDCPAAGRAACALASMAAAIAPQGCPWQVGSLELPYKLQRCLLPKHLTTMLHAGAT